MAIWLCKDQSSLSIILDDNKQSDMTLCFYFWDIYKWTEEWCISEQPKLNWNGIVTGRQRKRDGPRRSSAIATFFNDGADQRVVAVK